MAAPPLSVQPVESARLGEALAVADAAREADGADPLNEQTRLDLAAGRRHALIGAVAGEPVALAVTDGRQLDLVVVPDSRGRGYGTALLEATLPSLAEDATTWSHGDHPAARALAASHGFDRVRTLLRLVLPRLDSADRSPHRAEGTPGLRDAGIRLSAFDPATDAAEWLALNARAFAAHPEQGRMSIADLAEREDEPWFDPLDFLIARDADGRMLGFHWMKLEPGSDEGEVYVLGVAPDAAGRGLGRLLLTAGLERMRERGRTRASLYVEGDNAPALALYRSAGFVDDAVDVQYRRSR